MTGRTLTLGLIGLALTATSTASAQCPATRPTDPGGGFVTYDDPAVVETFDSPRVRVWYATAGDHAIPLTPTGPAGAPADAETTAAILEEAIDGFAAMGFLEARGDGHLAPCGGGDGRLDAYLVDFGAGADGTVGIDECVEEGGVTKCAGHVVLDHRFSGYASFAEGAETVGPHELFHLVQYAYDVDIDRFWAEGTAQWATKALHPHLDDLESFLPFFFHDLDRPLDTSPGGATAGFLYGSAVWPLFLDHQLGPEVILDAFDAMGAGASPSLVAVEEALAPRGRNLADTFADFSVFNAATGSRAGVAGYPDAASYPEAPVTPLGAGPGTLVEDRLAGLAAHLYTVPGGQRVLFDGDPAEVTARAIPLVQGRADVTAAVDLPADLEGDAIIVVAGRRIAKTDVFYGLTAEALPPPPAPPDDEPPVDDEPPAPTGPSAPPTASGCSVGGESSGHGLALLLLSLVWRIRDRNRIPRPTARTRPKTGSHV